MLRLIRAARLRPKYKRLAKFYLGSGFALHELSQGYSAEYLASTCEASKFVGDYDSFDRGVEYIIEQLP